MLRGGDASCNLCLAIAWRSSLVALILRFGCIRFEATGRALARAVPRTPHLPEMEQAGRPP